MPEEAKLWIDTKTEEEIETGNQFEAVQNLLEDIQCLKEDLEEARKEILAWREAYHGAAYNGSTVDRW